jgi:hypothetical protein
MKPVLIEQQLYNREMSHGHPIDLTKCQTDPLAFPFCSVDDLLVSTNKVAHELYGRKGRRGKWYDKLSIAVQDIRQYAPILDVFTQGQPGAVSLCWGMTRMILEVSPVLASSIIISVSVVSRHIRFFRSSIAVERVAGQPTSRPAPISQERVRERAAY